MAPDVGGDQHDPPAPVRCVYQVNAGSRLDASVHMTRLDPQTGARA
jgi:hypothetical protein